MGMTSSVTTTRGTQAGLAANERGSASRRPTIANSAKTAGQRASGFGRGFVETVIVKSPLNQSDGVHALSQVSP